MIIFKIWKAKPKSGNEVESLCTGLEADIMSRQEKCCGPAREWTRMVLS